MSGWRDLGKAWDILLGLPKSIRFNVHYFGLARGLRLPVLLSRRVRLSRLEGDVELARMRFGAARLGFATTDAFPDVGTRSVWHVTGRVRFGDGVTIGPAFRLLCEGDLTIGKGVDMNAAAHLFCASRMEIGDGGLWAWQVTAMDHDFHRIDDAAGKRINEPRAVVFSDGVWVGANALVLKGTRIAPGVVVGAGSVVSGAHDEPGSVIAGNPATVVKRGIRWSR